MSVEKKFSLILILLLVFVFGLFRLAGYLKYKQENELKEIPVTIEGIVRKPGKYMVPLGTTRFEILKVAGVLPNSDLTGLDIYAQAKSGESIVIGKMDKSVAMKTEERTGRSCRLNYAVGDVRIKDKAGKEGKAVANSFMGGGERLVTGVGATTELSLEDESLVDLQGNSELRIESLYEADDGGRLVIHFELLSGHLWSYIKPQPANIHWRFSTQYMIAEISGTEIEIDHTKDASVLFVKRGMVNVGRKGSDRRLSVNDGQKATVAADLQKEIVVAAYGEEDRRIMMRSDSVEKTSDYSKKAELRRFLFMIVPHYYVVADIDKDKSVVSMARVMPSTPVSEFVEGVGELGQVYLYGGVRLTVSVLERMLKKKIDRHAVLGRENIRKAIDIVGGIPVEVDNETAALLGIRGGVSKLSGEQVEEFIKLAKEDERMARQEQVIRAIFNEIVKSKIVLTRVVVSQIFGGLETDMDVDAVMSLYSIISSVENWKLEILDYKAVR